MMTSPNPSWKPGDAIQSPVEEMVEIDPAHSSAIEMYKLIIGSVVPRPIAFVSTQSADGSDNLAPYSFFNGVSSNPPAIMISVGVPQAGTQKDTLRNIEATGEFVVNSANEWLIEPLVHCAGNYPYGVSEMKEVGLTPLPSAKVKPLRVKESAVQMECRLLQTVQIGDGSVGSSTVIFGEIVYVHVDKRCYKDGKIIFSEYKNIGRLGGYGYGRITETFDIAVPRVG